MRVVLNVHPPSWQQPLLVKCSNYWQPDVEEPDVIIEHRPVWTFIDAFVLIFLLQLPFVAMAAAAHFR